MLQYTRRPRDLISAASGASQVQVSACLGTTIHSSPQHVQYQGAVYMCIKQAVDSKLMVVSRGHRYRY